MMRRSGAVLLAALGVCLVAAPVAGAATRKATVLSVNRAGHTVRVVGANHQAKTLRVKGKVARKVVTGSRVAFRVRGRSERGIRTTRRGCARWMEKVRVPEQSAGQRALVQRCASLTARCRS